KLPGWSTPAVHFKPFGLAYASESGTYTEAPHAGAIVVASRISQDQRFLQHLRLKSTTVIRHCNLFDDWGFLLFFARSHHTFTFNEANLDIVCARLNCVVNWLANSSWRVKVRGAQRHECLIYLNQGYLRCNCGFRGHSRISFYFLNPF